MQGVKYSLTGKGRIHSFQVKEMAEVPGPGKYANLDGFNAFGKYTSSKTNNVYGISFGSSRKATKYSNILFYLMLCLYYV